MKHNDPQLAYTSYILRSAHEYERVDDIMSSLKQANIQRPTNEFLWTILYSFTFIQLHYYHNFLQNKMQEREVQCTKLYLTFNYDTPAHDLDSDILPACLSSCSTMNTSTLPTCSSSSLVCTVPLLFCILQHICTLAFHFNLT